MQKVISVILICLFSNAVYADEIKLYKKGTTVVFEEDMHCMTNETALKLLGKLQLCPKQCQIRLDGLASVHKIELDALNKKLVLQKESYLKIIAVKDETIDKIHEEAVVAASENGSEWWKITLYITTGLALGAGIAIGATHLAP
jgi:hypothetical protein